MAALAVTTPRALPTRLPATTSHLKPNTNDASHPGMSPLTVNDRQRRVLQLSREWGVELPPTQAPPMRPQKPPSFWTPADDQTAEELMVRRATELSQYRPKSGLSKAFPSGNLKKGKAWDPREVLNVLTSWVANGGSPGVAEALISKLSIAGVDISGNQTKQKTGLLSRRKSLDTFVDREKLLKLAVEGNHLELVQVLAPHADSLALDSALPVAIRGSNSVIAEVLLRYGAAIGQTPDGQDAFRRACVVQAKSDMVGLILRSDGRPPPALVSVSMTDASRSGCLDTLLHLSRSNADGNHNRSEALKAAVTLGRKDLCVAIIMGHRPPQMPGLGEAFQMLCMNSAINPATKLDIAELLLCAGAEGDHVAEALEVACESQFHEMALLLASHGTSIEYNDAVVLKTAIARGELDLVNALLSDAATLNPTLASSCVPLLAKQVSTEYRNAILELLLKKGANGIALDDMLVVAAEAGDIEAMDLLLDPFSPETVSTNGADYSVASNGTKRSTARHAIASVDHNAGEALRTTVIRADALMTEKILARNPSQETLSAAFPLTKKLPSQAKYVLIQLFLSKSLSGPCLHGALNDAISEDKSQRDDALIRLLLEHNADINFGHGPGLKTLIKQNEVELLRDLLRFASPQTAAARVPDAMQLTDHKARYEIMAMLINAGAVIAAQKMSTALLQTLSEKPVDMSLLHLLLQQGGADINMLDGAITKQAVSNPDPKVLETVLTVGKPSMETVNVALQSLAPLPSTEGKAWKLRGILARSNSNLDLNWLLVHEVQSLMQTKNNQASLSSLQQLLDAGTDPNAFKAAALCHAVIGTDENIINMIMNAKVAPTAASIGTALPHVLRITESEERLRFTEMMVDAGADPMEANRALIHAITTYPSDKSLHKTLAAIADVSDGEALSQAVTKESPETMELLLARFTYSAEMRGTMLTKVMEVKARNSRHQMCSTLLRTGVSPASASGALLVAARDGDVNLGDLLMAHGASIATNNGQAIIEACRGGSPEVLGVLLKQDGQLKRSTLEAGFQAATEVRDLNKRAVVLEQLLQKGVKGELVDAQLETAARYGEEGQAMLRILLAAGADANYNNGECVVAATRSAFIGNLELLLGLWDERSAQKKVSQPTLARSLKASWGLNRDSRFHIIRDLFQAGMQTSEELHIALNDAVNEEDPEERLVQLLLEHGASPSANGCKTLVDAANNAASTSLALLLKQEIQAEDINRSFNQAFGDKTFKTWFSERGLETAKMLLEKGAGGEALSGALALTMKRSSAERQELADKFVSLLVSSGADVNYNNGEPLQNAASRANVAWSKQLLALKPSIQTLSLAFQCIFDTALPQDEVFDLFKLFAEYRDGDVRIDVMSEQQSAEPLLVRALSQYPRSTKILEALLDAGLYHDQPCHFKLHSDVEEPEQMTLLSWAIAQPQKRVSTAVIETLVARGADVNAETIVSRTTPLMIAIQTRRPDVLKALLLDGAEVDILDYQGRTPLSMATQLGGDISTQMMASLLAADPSRDDGSLHNAARELNLPVVKVLVQAGHDPDFPSPLHDGRSALAEICLHGADERELPTEKERTMQKIMTVLIESKSDLSIKSHNKTLLQLCFSSADPPSTTRCFLKSGMWKHINAMFNQITLDGYVYSPTMYLSKQCASYDATAELLKLLRANRATDVYYATSGAQPDDAVGLPADMEVEERSRRARMSRLAEEQEEFSITLARKREIASVEQQILTQKSEMEDARRRKLHNEDVAALRSHAQLQEQLASTAHSRRLQEQHTIADASIGRTRALARTELDAQEARHRQALEWEGKMNTERVENARALSSIRVSERHEIESMEKSAEQRIKNRLEAQKKLVESQEKLAKRLADGPSGVGMGDPRRQIGYVTEMNS